MRRLVTIEDLSGDITEALREIEALGPLYEEFKKNDDKYREIILEIGGDGSRSVGVHASEVSGCLRKMVYSMSEVDKKVRSEDADVNMRMRFQLGHVLHALVQSDVQHMCAETMGEMVFEDEVKISPELGGTAEQYNVHSHSDGVFTKLDKEFNPTLRVNFEIKTMSGPEYDKLTKPKPEHVEQAHVYMKCLDVPVTWFFYYNKSNSNWTKPRAPFLITFDHKIWDRIENRIKRAYKYIGDGELPNREEGRPCGWCPFASKCNPMYLKLRSTKSSGRKAPPRKVR